MAIVKITGGVSSGKTFVANALRNRQIAFGESAVIFDENKDADIGSSLEKIINGATFDPTSGSNINDIPWKNNPSVILVGKKADQLDEIEKLLPGFTKKFGPVYSITLKVTKE